MFTKKRNITMGILNITAATAAGCITGLLVINAINNLKKN